MLIYKNPSFSKLGVMVLGTLGTAALGAAVLGTAALGAAAILSRWGAVVLLFAV